jgi:hypothetical protein
VPARFGDRGGHHRHPGTVDGDVELVRHRHRWQHAHTGAHDRCGFGGEASRGCRAVGLGGAFDPLGGQLDSGQLGEQVGGGGERDGRGGARGDPAQPR